MPNAFPCQNTPPDCECLPFPVRNFSVETPDVAVELCTVTVPARTGTSFASPCTRTVETPNAANPMECVDGSDNFYAAQTSAQECQNSDPDPPNFYTGTFFNREQTCVVECPDGTSFSWTVPALLIGSAWQGDADARAYALACKRAKANRICFTTDSPLTPCCVGTFASIVIGAQGGMAPYSFAVTSGSIPAGMTFDSVGLLSGTPTASGTSTFDVTVTDDIGSTQVKAFVLRVVNITTTSPLPSGTVGTPYSQALAATGTTGTVVWSLVSSTLPDGLTLSDAGVISGTPTMAQTVSFTASLLDGGGASCEKMFSLEIVQVVALAAYWNYSDYNTVPSPDELLDSTANNHDLDILASYNVVPGLIGNCMSTFQNTCETFLDPLISQFDFDLTKGFTVAGWIKFDDIQEGVITIWAIAYGIQYFSLTFFTDSLVMDSDAGPEATAPYPSDGQWHFYRSWVDTNGQLNVQIDNGIIYQSTPSVFSNMVCDSFQLQGDTTAIPDTLNMFDETGYWSRVLSTTEGTNLYNGGAGITFGNPLLPP
jgi:hypothetical protein